ncbi:MAG: hypothetical protein N4A35_03850 [Flavobacteriales bacterium]|jgi:hypothetical protein|nr:hypothetical protein [Flavobacteriales bacterium]
MKQTFTIIAFLLISLIFNAQTWVDLGIKGGVGANFLMNQNIWKDVDYNHTFSSGYSFGGKIGFNFNQEHEVTFDAMFGNFKQKFDYSITDTISDETTNYFSEMGFNRTDLSLMYRHNKNGSYLEFGPCIALLSSPYRKDSRIVNVEFNDSHVNLMNKGLILGFGNYVMGTESFGITAGMRITQYFDDFISPKGQTALLPTLTKYETYTASRPLFIELMFEANFDFAYVAKAKCGRKKLMFF